MYLPTDEIRRLEGRLGAPREAAVRRDFAEREFGLVERCLRMNRAHDLTLFIRRHDGEFAVIRKPGYPPGVFRPPSGGAEPGEPIEGAALREAIEETGLSIGLERYLLRVRARFRHAGREAPLVTHVFLARALTDELGPRDRKEIAEACWCDAAAMAGLLRERMLRIGSEGMRYRVDLQDAALHLLGLLPPGIRPALLAGDDAVGSRRKG